MGTRSQWVASQPTVAGMNNADGPLVACLGDMVADTNNAGTTMDAQHASVAQLILHNKPDYYVALGDNCYDNGALEMFQTEYDRTFGQLKDRTLFCVGNHELAGCLDGWRTDPVTVVSGGTAGSTQVVLTGIPTGLAVGNYITFNPSDPVLMTGTSKTVSAINGTTITMSTPLAADIPAQSTAWTVNDGRGFYSYAGMRAGPPMRGYHAQDIGRWRWYFLNSTSGSVAAAGSAQLKWLASDLEAHPNRPIIASWHHPRWTDGSSGSVADDNNYDPLVQLLRTQDGARRSSPPMTTTTSGGTRSGRKVHRLTRCTTRQTASCISSLVAVARTSDTPCVPPTSGVLSGSTRTTALCSYAWVPVSGPTSSASVQTRTAPV